MMPMPVNKRPKPIMIWPMFRFLGALMNTYRMAPAKATRGAKVSGLQNSIQVLPPDISDRRILSLIHIYRFYKIVPHVFHFDFTPPSGF